MSTLNVSDPVRNVMLDFIAVKESNSNYDAFVNHANNKDSLAANTINGIYAFQRKLIAWGEPSSAVGRYQFVQRTLSMVIQQLSIPLTDHFTDELQDKLACRLLDNRGYGNWLSKIIDDSSFAHNLSCEWASLPDPLNDGRSHYDGVGGNSALYTLDEVYAMLDKARTLIKLPTNTSSVGTVQSSS